MSLVTVRRLLFLGLTVCGINGWAQQPDSLEKKSDHEIKGQTKVDKISVLFYMRVISDTQGNVRVDENVVGNFRLNSLLRLEVGVRKGERPQSFDSYYHYKLELQSRYFWKTVRLVARLSENIIQYPTPYYSKSNYLVIAESKWPLSKRFIALAAGGYVFTFQKNNLMDAAPTTDGIPDSYATYKFGIRYALLDKGFVEATYGAYDVFNPYLLQSPFVQVTSDYEVSHKATLYGYLRYQYDHSFGQPMNNFLGLGVRVHFR